MHENIVRGQSYGGGKSVYQWQGNSLFGLEYYGEKEEEKRHGYSAGRLEFLKNTVKLRHFPRKWTGDKDTNGTRFVPDNESCVLKKDDGTSSEILSYTPRNINISTEKIRPSILAKKRTLELFIEATRKFCDIVDLAGLGDDERHLAMQRFLLRQLYVPLRIDIDVRGRENLSDELTEDWEDRRAQQRLQAAGRINRRNTEDEIDHPVGERLKNSSRLVILGDPGSGKTTLLRWLATAFLLRRSGDSDFSRLPDVNTLPESNLLPILVRCRELDHSQLNRCTLEDILLQTIKISGFPEPQVPVLRDTLQELIGKGEAILLIDGLDEITEPTVRAAFCKQIETIAELFPSTPIVVTSRIVGYREMNHRLGKGFEHGTLADLTPEAKDNFVFRWCEVTETLPERRKAEAERLIGAIHSLDRIERLTGNPMLLTTMALVQRKVGKLPTRRHKLYEEAVGVLLQSRPDLSRPTIDLEEALPQLQYIAYAMCDRGVQQIRRDELLELLEGVRRDYPHIRPISRQLPEDFIAQLERRSSLIVEVGEKRHDGNLMPIYEFRHLTFQEYLAGLALVKGRFPGHKRDSTLAQRVGPLAGRTIENVEAAADFNLEVNENWREAIRLCVASANDDDVDEVLLAIARTRETEDPNQIGRPRAILAALCLADEPNVDHTTGNEVLNIFLGQIKEGDGDGTNRTGIDKAAIELSSTVWVKPLQSLLIEKFMTTRALTRQDYGGLSGTINEQLMPTDINEMRLWLNEQVLQISNGNEAHSIEAALTIMSLVFSEKIQKVTGLIPALFKMLDKGPASSHAACWTLGWLTEVRPDQNKGMWKPNHSQMARLSKFLADVSADPETIRWLSIIFGNCASPIAIEQIIIHINHPFTKTSMAAINALGKIGDSRAVEPLLTILAEKAEQNDIRVTALNALGRIGDNKAVEPLLTVVTDKAEQSEIRMAAINALEKIGDDKAVEPLLTVVTDKAEQNDIRIIAINTLGRMERNLGSTVLKQLLTNDDPWLRSNALRVLSIPFEVENRRLLATEFNFFGRGIDPNIIIDEKRVTDAANHLHRTEMEIRKKYEELQIYFGLKLSWQK